MCASENLWKEENCKKMLNLLSAILLLGWFLFLGANKQDVHGNGLLKKLYRAVLVVGRAGILRANGN